MPLPTPGELHQAALCTWSRLKQNLNVQSSEVSYYRNSYGLIWSFSQKLLPDQTKHTTSSVVTRSSSGKKRYSMEGYACWMFPLFPIPKMYFMVVFWYFFGRIFLGFRRNTWVLSWNVRPTWAVFKASWSSVCPSVALVFGFPLTLKDKRLLLSQTWRFGRQNVQGQLLWIV